MTPFLQRILVAALIIFGIWIAAFFGLQTFHAFNEVREHRPPSHSFKKGQPETNVQLIEEWMTVPFIGKLYHVPPALIFDALGIPFEENKEKSLKQINEKYFPSSPGFVLDTVKATVQANLPPQAAIPPATAMPPATSVPSSPP